MKVDFSQIITNLDGTPVRAGPEADAPPATLGFLCMQALAYGGKPDIPIAEKIRRGRLAERAFDGGECELSPEDLTVIRAAVGEMCTPLIVVQAFRLLGDGDGKVVPMRA